MPHIIAPDAFVAQPWKNGGGVTREIVRWPDAEDFEVRVSLAEVAAAGPFSQFPGVRRWSFLAGDAPIELEVGGVVHALIASGDHVELGGATAITCALPAGPTRLLNLLVREGAAVQIGRGPCPLAIRFVFALAPMAWLPAGHAAVFEPPAVAALTHGAVWLASP